VALRHRPHRILYVPLDDRPSNLRAPRLLAQMVDYEIIIPPVEMLGCFRVPGQPEEIGDWLLAHADSQPDVIILSIDMLAYGGLWASRCPGTRAALAQQRLGLLGQLRAACPDTTIYGFNTILRLGTITSSDEGALHLAALYHHSVLVGRVADKADPEDRRKVAALEREIPASVLGEYQAIRERNQQVNLRAMKETAEGNLDLLVFGQDVAERYGVHRQEQAVIENAVEESGLAGKVFTMPGADELGMCLLARFVHKHMGKTPSVRVLVINPESLRERPCGEDRPFSDSLRAHIELVGAREAAECDRNPDMVLVVNGPAAYDRADLHDPAVARNHRKRARSFLSGALAASSGRGAAVCDAAFSNGADDIFVQELISATPELPRLLSYAGCNTASNSLGSALAHAALRLISLQDKGAFDLASRLGDMSPMRYLQLLDTLIASEKAHIRLLLTRFADDWLYQARIRPRLTEHICNGLHHGVFDLSGSYAQAESLVRDSLTSSLSDLWIDQFLGRRCVSLGSDSHEEELSTLVLAELEETRISLPWRRLFEMDLEVEFGVQLVASGYGKSGRGATEERRRNGGGTAGDG